MLIFNLNLRRNGTSTWRFSDDSQYFDAYGKPLAPSAVSCLLDGKDVAFIVHGYNVKNAGKSYSDVTRNILTRMPKAYGAIVRVWWPGSEFAPAFLLARRRSPKAGRMLKAAILALSTGSGHPRSVDIQAHSLGCMVALEAAMPDSPGFAQCIRNLILAAPAVDDEDLTRGEGPGSCGKDGRYIPAARNVSSIHVFYSKHDIVAVPYSLMRADKMMGAVGPSSSGPLPKNVIPHDFTRYISVHHSGYKGLPLYFGDWDKIAAGIHLGAECPEPR
jgi:hypothetical protein